jgi:hypothetical protein
MHVIKLQDVRDVVRAISLVALAIVLFFGVVLVVRWSTSPRQ